MNDEMPFIGRESILKTLNRRVRDLKDGFRQNIAVVGGRYIGKTALVQKFLRDLEEEQVLPIYLDLEGKDEHYLFSKFIRSVLYHFAKIRNLPRQEELSLLMATTQEHIPDTIQAIHRILDLMSQEKYTIAFDQLLNIPEILNRESGIYSVVIMDEFQTLEQLDINDAFKFMSDKIMTQRTCLYMIMSSFEQQARRILSEKLSLLFGNFEIISLGSFDVQTSEHFIDRSLGDIRMGVQLRGFLIDFTGGHPLYLSILLQELINLSAVHKQKEIYMPLLSQGIEHIIFHQWGVLSRHFELVMNQLCQGKSGRSMANVIMTLASGCFKLQELMEQLDLKRNAIVQRLNKLMEHDLIEKNGSYYYFTDKLFRYWVKYVYQRRLTDLDLEFGRQRVQFKDDIYECIQSFQKNCRLELQDRLMDLLHCFDDEVFVLEGRKYKLPSFKEVELIKSNDMRSLDVIRAHSDEGEWKIIFKKDAVQEGEIDTFVKQSRLNKEKSKRCVVISLNKLDENARLRALEERMWIWSESEINLLMNLYDKPVVV